MTIRNINTYEYSDKIKPVSGRFFHFIVDSKIGLGMGTGNTNFREHRSKSPGDRLSEYEAWLAGVHPSTSVVNKQEPRQDFIIEAQVQEMKTVLLLQGKLLHVFSFYLLR